MDIAAISLETYEDFVSAGITLCEDMDNNRWAMGDLVLLATPKGQHRTGKTRTDFARDVDISPRTMMNYCQLAAFYPPSVRGNYPNLRHTHFRSAHQHSHGHLPTALAYLEIASRDGLKTGAFELWLDEHKLSRETVLCAILARAKVFIPPDEQELIAEVEAVLHGNS